MLPRHSIRMPRRESEEEDMTTTEGRGRVLVRGGRGGRVDWLEKSGRLEMNAGGMAGMCKKKKFFFLSLCFVEGNVVV